MIIIQSNFRFVLIQIVIKHLTSYSNPSPSFMETWSIKNTFFFYLLILQIQMASKVKSVQQLVQWKAKIEPRSHAVRVSRWANIWGLGKMGLALLWPMTKSNTVSGKHHNNDRHGLFRNRNTSLSSSSGYGSSSSESSPNVSLMILI